MKVCKALLVLVCFINCLGVAYAAEYLNKREMLARLDFHGIETRMREKTFITPKQSKMLVDKPASIFSIYVDLKHTSNIRVTAIEFRNEQQAELMDNKPINGFHALNWFFLGTIDTKSSQDIINALVQ